MTKFRLAYKGFKCEAVFDRDEQEYKGHVTLEKGDVAEFVGRNVKEAVVAFQNLVDDHLKKA